MIVNSKHILLITIIGIVSTIVFSIIGFEPYWLIYTAIMYFMISCLGITITFHRYLTHRSFTFYNKWLEKLFILLGSIAGTGSALGWVAVHRNHHKHSDTALDPHGPGTGWRNFFNDYDDDVKYILVRDLIKDKYILTLHKYGTIILAIFYTILYVFGGLHALVFLGLLPQALNIIVSASCNYFAHLYGYRTYNTDDESKNTWWLAIPTWGDSWHNNHHAKPHLYSFKHKWWELDISGLIISLIRSKNVSQNSK